MRSMTEEVKMMKDPGSWPMWPVLPVVKHAAGSCGILTADGKPIIYLVNMLDLSSGVLKDMLVDKPKVEFESFEAIFNAGWEVDRLGGRLT